MKRRGNLFHSICGVENLYLAFFKAKRGKSNRIEIAHFQHELKKNIDRISQQLISDEVEIGKYTYFKVFDPKERVICAASFRERIIHHAIMNICHIVFDEYLIEDSYASRKGKGTHAAIARAQFYQSRYLYYLKLDIRKYFDNIDHQILKSQLRRRFKDGKLLILFERIIDSYCVQIGKGVPIGNLTSQYFANHYLGEFDRFCKQFLRVPGYARYMDDIVLWSNDKVQLKQWGMECRLFLKQKLHLELKVFHLSESKAGLPFLGYLLLKQRMQLLRKSKLRFKKKLAKYYFLFKIGLWDQKKFQSHSSALCAFAKKGDMFFWRKEQIKKWEMES